MPERRSSAAAAPLALALIVTLSAAAASETAAVEAAIPELTPCEMEDVEGVLCAAYPVFEDRAAGAGRRIELAVRVLPRTGGGPATEPVFLIAGGPGEPSVPLLPGIDRTFPELREKRDLVAVDLRGSGESRPQHCIKPGMDEDPRVVFGELFPAELVKRCRAELEREFDLEHYTTEMAIDDLDEVRAWLGYERVLVWGGSYGTRAALVWLQRHPDTVAGAVLDSPAPVPFTAPLHYARDAQDALDRILAACAADAACSAAVPDAPGDLARVLERLAAGEVSARVTPAAGGDPVPVPIGRGHFGYAVRGMLYRPGAFARIASQLRDAAESGDLSVFAQAYYDRERRLWPYVAIANHLQVLCSEDAWRIGDEEAARISRGTFLGTWLIDQYLQACGELQRGEVSAGYYEPVTAPAPVLIHSGAFDPTTPPRWGDEIARHLPRVLHVTYPAGAHGSLNDACGRELTKRFLLTASLEGLDPSCAGDTPLEFEVEPASLPEG